MQWLKGKGVDYKRDKNNKYFSDDIIEIEIYEVPKSDANPKGDLYIIKYRGQEIGRYINFEDVFSALERKFPNQPNGFDVPSFRWEWR